MNNKQVLRHVHSEIWHKIWDKLDDCVSCQVLDKAGSQITEQINSLLDDRILVLVWEEINERS